MDSANNTLGDFDLQPDPRILPMLGEINLAPWKCLAELVDNAVDGFLTLRRAGGDGSGREVRAAIPLADTPSARVTVVDNGPGMDPSTLEKAVRAGWTSNDPLNNLGMFGMGFNIATARLGTTTEVWTTRQGDLEWHGLKIDFREMMRLRHFRTPRLSRRKIDPNEHGTEITIRELKPEQRAWFAKPANRSKLTRDLGAAYGAMLRGPGSVPLSFGLFLNGTSVRGRIHCVWGGPGNPDRTVQTSRFGIVNSFQPINVQLADRSFCADCWQWLPSGEPRCPACGTTDAIVVRKRSVHGWVGIQRYLSDTDYGIDFLRHGRTIEITNRDLFAWYEGERVEPEYPIDDPRRRGRIVGEIHLDHCRVTYTKDRFDRNDPAWEEMVGIVRGEGPLRPDKAAELGYSGNQSPLFRLFQTFRRSTPKPKVAGCYANLLVAPSQERMEEMGKRFHAGEPAYQTDEKWWELVEEADRELLLGSGQPDDRPEAGGAPGVPWPGAGSPGGKQDGTNGGGVPPAPPPPTRSPLASLSQEYRDERFSLRWDVKAYTMAGEDPAGNDGDRPWTLTASPAGVYHFLVNQQHEIFRSATLTPLDALLNSLAHTGVDLQRGNPAGPTFADLLASLRLKYAKEAQLDPVILAADATAVLRRITTGLGSRTTADDSRALFEELSPAEKDAVLQKMAVRSEPQPQQALASGRFWQFAPWGTLLRVFEAHPELFFDGACWDVPFATLDYGRPAATEEARARLSRYYSGMISDAMWLAEQDANDLTDASRERLLRAALALDLLDADSAQKADA